MKINKNNAIISKSESWKMFEQISPTYDLLNHVLSFGLDIHWRKCLARHLLNRKHMKVLDLATGTADVLLSIVKQNGNVKNAFGIDLSGAMLGIGQQKIASQGWEGRIILKRGDINDIPFGQNVFDNVTIAFGIRNVENPDLVLKEMLRVLNPGGRALILEFSLPKNQIQKFLHLIFLKLIVPCIGWTISGNFKAYRYLNQTIETFPYGDKFCGLMRQCGFQNVEGRTLMNGVATIYLGEKPV